VGQVRGLQAQLTSPTAPVLACYYYWYGLAVISLEGEHSGLSLLESLGPEAMGKAVSEI